MFAADVKPRRRSWLRRLFAQNPNGGAPPGTITKQDRFQNLTSFAYAGSSYTVGLNQTIPGQSVEAIENSFVGYSYGLFKSNGVVAAAMAARLRVFAQLRFLFQTISPDGRPGDFTDSQALLPLRRPWPGGTTRQLLATMIQHADLAGNAYVARPKRFVNFDVGSVPSNELMVLRPDWTVIVVRGDPDAADAQVYGYVYQPGGPASGKTPIAFDAADVAHFAPLPDPIAKWRGMSWLTPVLRNAQAHAIATEHKIAYVENGGTPNMVIKFDPSVSADAVKVFKDVFLEETSGSDSYVPWFLGGGADPMPVGSTMQELTFAETQDAEEAIIAANAGVPLAILQLGEGLQGSTLNAGNIEAVKRIFQETTVADLATAAADAFSTIIEPGESQRLWWDVRDVPFFRADAKAAGEVRGLDSQSMRRLVDGGWEPNSIVAAIAADDWSLLEHTGVLSVQLQQSKALAESDGSGKVADDESEPE